MHRRLFLRHALVLPSALPTLLPAAAFAAATAPTFALDRDGTGFAIAADALLDAPRETAWSTLVDYEALDRFVPGMRASRILERHGPRVVVHQTGAARFGPFSERFDVTLAVEEQAGERIDAEAIAGDFSELRSHYVLHALGPQRTQLAYRARLRPRREPPPLIGTAIMRSVARDQFEALVREIERRARLGVTG
jgi:ribosome-associated toxin RatA of RatAB toxin-antitoxin module